MADRKVLAWRMISNFIILSIVLTSSAFGQFTQLPGPYGNSPSPSCMIGDTLFAGSDVGAFYSTDEGDRWIKLSIPNSLALYPGGNVYAHGHTLFVTITDTIFGLSPSSYGDPTRGLKLYRSTDRGGTFSLVGSCCGSLIAVESLLYVASENLASCLRSSDDGITWDTIKTANLLPFAGASNSVFAYLFRHLSVSTDSGRNWLPLSYPDSIIFNSPQIVIEGNGDTAVYCLGRNISWPNAYLGLFKIGLHQAKLKLLTQYPTSTACPVTFAFSNGSLFAADCSRITQYNLRTRISTDLSYNVEDFGGEIALIYALPSGNLLLQNWPAINLLKLSMSSDQWVRSKGTISCSGTELCLHKGQLFAAVPGSPASVQVSVDSGLSWKTLANFWANDVVSAPSGLYALGSNLWRLSDTTWADLLNNSTPQYLKPRGDDLFTVGTTGFLKSSDSGNTWSPLTPIPKDTNFSHYSHWVITDAKSSILIGISNYFIRTTDDGLSWHVIDLGLDDYYDIAVLKTIGRFTFCAINLGPGHSPTRIFISSDEGVTWSSLGTDIPRDVRDIALIDTSIIVSSFDDRSTVFYIAHDLASRWSDSISAPLWRASFLVNKNDMFLCTGSSGAWKVGIDYFLPGYVASVKSEVPSSSDIDIHSDMLELDLASAQVLTTTFFDILGRQLSSHTMSLEAGKQRINLHELVPELPHGLFFCAVSQNGNWSRVIRYFND